MDRESAIFVGALVGAIWLFLTWTAICVWAFNDIRERTENLVLRFISVILVAFLLPGFNLPGLLLYLLIRPRETLAEVYSRQLEQEVLLREVGEGAVCYECRQPVGSDFLFCPYCRARLREPCTACRRPLSLFWVICPYCGVPKGAERTPQVIAGQPGSSPQPANSWEG